MRHSCDIAPSPAGTIPPAPQPTEASQHTTEQSQKRQIDEQILIESEGLLRNTIHWQDLSQKPASPEEQQKQNEKRHAYLQTIADRAMLLTKSLKDSPHILITTTALCKAFDILKDNDTTRAELILNALKANIDCLRTQILFDAYSSAIHNPDALKEGLDKLTDQALNAALHAAEANECQAMTNRYTEDKKKLIRKANKKLYAASA